MKLKLLLSALLIFSLVILSMPAASSSAQTQTEPGAKATGWEPAWVDLSGTGLIQVTGQNANLPKIASPSAEEATEADQNDQGKGNGFVSNLLTSLYSAFGSPSNTAAGWETIFSDDLEGTFPGAWNVFDNNDETSGEYFWAKKDCRPHNGSYSAWVVGGGVDGSTLSCSSDYPDGAKSWMIYGPFSLEEASEAEFRLWYWLNSEVGYDKLFVGASVDGTSFYGGSTSGVYDWTERIFDLSDVYTIGDLTGQPEVWVAVTFNSDSSIHETEGAYVDDLEIRKYVEDDTTPPATTEPPPATTEPPPATTEPPPATTEPPPTDTPVPPALEAYLPIMNMLFPFVPDPPVLNAIDNSDGDGNYTVSWSSPEGSDTYKLEEDDSADFSSPTTVYSGSSTSKAISGKPMGTYYYRVMGANPGASSDWSNVVSVKVTVPPPACPQTGPWSGTTSQGRSISFTVENTTQCQIAAGTLRITIRDSCYATGTTTFTSSIPINNNHFSVGSASYGVQVIGDFTSATTADGTFHTTMPNPFPPPTYCDAAGTWTATP